MSKLRRTNGKALSKFLESKGFECVRMRGSHRRYVHPDGRKTVVPVHATETLGVGLLLKILKQCKVSRDEYNEFGT